LASGPKIEPTFMRITGASINCSQERSVKYNKEYICPCERQEGVGNNGGISPLTLILITKE